MTAYDIRSKQLFTTFKLLFISSYNVTNFEHIQACMHTIQLEIFLRVDSTYNNRIVWFCFCSTVWTLCTSILLCTSLFLWMWRLCRTLSRSFLVSVTGYSAANIASVIRLESISKK